MPTRAERLADHFMRRAGIAAVYVDACGGIGAADYVSTFQPFGCVLLCCARGPHIQIATKAYLRANLEWGQAAALDAVRAAAAEAGISLTPHETVIRRASAAVEAVSATIRDMQHSGQMKEINRDFKIARKGNPSLRYHDYLHDRKAAMLDALASDR